jgi:hypothetical protein
VIATSGFGGHFEFSTSCPTELTINYFKKNLILHTLSIPSPSFPSPAFSHPLPASPHPRLSFLPFPEGLGARLGAGHPALPSHILIRDLEADDQRCVAARRFIRAFINDAVIHFCNLEAFQVLFIRFIDFENVWIEPKIVAMSGVQA